MDPLSILASIAGVTTAGIQLSKAIYELVESFRDAPSEVSDIARGISDLSRILNELRRALRDGRDMCRQSLLRRVKSTIRRVYSIHNSIWDLIDGVDGLARLKWIFRRSKVRDLLWQIESHKTGISMMLQIITISMLSHRAQSMSRKGASDMTPGDDVTTDEEIAREQVETLVQAAYHSIREAEAMPKEDEHGQPEDDQDGLHSSNEERVGQVQVWEQQSTETSQWLYDMIFDGTDPTRSSVDGGPSQAQPPSGPSQDDAVLDDQPITKGHDASESLALTLSRAEDMQVVLHDPEGVFGIVQKLLAEWTTPFSVSNNSVASDNTPASSSHNDGERKKKEDENHVAVPPMPSAPTPPATATTGVEPLGGAIAFRSYALAFTFYFREWDKWNSRLVEHFTARSRIAEKKLNEEQNLTTATVKTYLTWMGQDDYIRKIWDDGCQAHRRKVQQFLAQASFWGEKPSARG